MNETPAFEFDTAAFLSADDTELEFNITDFNLTDAPAPAASRHVKPVFSKKPIIVDYKNAQDLARSIRLFPGEQIHGLVRGDFIFGDFIEALLFEKDAVAKNVFISTLSLSQNNIDSFRHLMDKGLIENLTLMVSNYFYSHEKHQIIRYMLGELDIDNRFQCLVCRNHTKITLLEIENIRLVITGSSNLRSSQSIEQYSIHESPELFDFYKKFFDEHAGNAIINKAINPTGGKE